jgi:hypothetical protein
MTTYPTKQNFIKNGDDLLGSWAYRGHHVVATANIFVNGVIEQISKTFDGKSPVLNRSQAVRWVLASTAE